MRRVFITGITGQDGGYLTEALLGRGLEVSGLVHAGDDQVAPLLARTPDVRLHTADLTSSAEMTAVVEASAPDVVFHLAGRSSVAQSWEAPLLTQQVNAVGTGVLLDAVWRWQQRSGTETRLVHASSAEIFGRAATSPQTESTPIAPTSPYGATKAYAHHLVHVYRDRGLHAINVILYNHESPRRPPTFVTRKIADAAAAASLGLIDHVDLGNLDARRDWGWAPDYVDAMIRAAEFPEPDDYVVATGVTHSVADFVERAFARVGLDAADFVRVSAEFARPTDTAVQCGDAGHARAQLGWRPTVGFDGVVDQMVDASVEQYQSPAT